MNVTDHGRDITVIYEETAEDFVDRQRVKIGRTFLKNRLVNGNDITLQRGNSNIATINVWKEALCQTPRSGLNLILKILLMFLFRYK
jgi:hypothetical protein